MEPNIEVAARIRPPIHTSHLMEDVCLYADTCAKEVILANQMSFYVDYALPIETTQSQVFDVLISPRIDYMLQGYNVSFIAYGHINSGKTYTMLGPGLHCALSETTYGILPRSAREIFNRLLTFRQQFGLQFKVSVSFIEICNEEARDLLSTNNCGSRLGFKTNKKGFTVLSGVEEIECHNVSEVFNCLRQGMINRKSVRTNINSGSSLSHCVVTLKVEQKWLSNQGVLENIVSQAMFVDLAGSEQTFVMSPTDTQPISNMGLGVISAIIASFSGQWLPSSPFTQSLLFPLLKDSFIGAIKTLLICCLSPCSSDYSETLNSLRLIDHIHTLNKYSYVRETIKLNIHDRQVDSEELKKDSFSLEFAASQWLKLVSNAEGLFSKLVKNDMPEDAREQIEEWLCLKQECEECLGVDSRTVSLHRIGQSLEMIEEVTETDTKSKSNCSSISVESIGRSSEIEDILKNEIGEDLCDDEDENSEDDDDVESKEETEDDDFDIDDEDSRNLSKAEEQDLIYASNRADFLDKLEMYIERFKTVTDKTIDAVINKNQPCIVAKKPEAEQKPRRSINDRRKSILPSENQICLSNLSLNTTEKVVEEEEVIKEDVVSLDDKTARDSSESLTEKPKTSSNRSLLLSKISLKGRLADSEDTVDVDVKEALRHEIRNLRKTRVCLVEQRRNLDAKFNKDKVLSNADERKFIECDEAIEAIDATIEYKNELMCGRKNFVNMEFREKGEEMLIARLMKLSTPEMQTLLYKYFKKVVDLRESGRKMEIQVAELDRQAESQAWKIQALSNALQQAHLESERRIVAAQKEHQEKLHLIFRHFADDKNGHGSDADDTEKCRRQNKALKQRVLELETMLYKGRSIKEHQSSQPEPSTASATQLNNIPQRNLKQLQGATASHTTKVTRQKNKLIIQQQKTKKPSKET